MDRSSCRVSVSLTGGSTYALAKLGHGYALAGRKDEAHKILHQLDEMSRRKYVSSYDAALIHVGLGDRQEAFARLNQAVEERSLWLGYLKVEPQLDRLRRDPRFPDLLSRLGLPA